MRQRPYASDSRQQAAAALLPTHCHLMPISLQTIRVSVKLRPITRSRL